MGVFVLASLCTFKHLQSKVKNSRKLLLYSIQFNLQRCTMSKILIIGNQEFEFPEQGTNAPWGEQVTDWAVAVTEALTIVQQPNDIVTTTALINNNQASFANIPGFSFDTSEVVSINAEFIIKRSTDTNNLVESGLIKGNFDGTTWTCSQVSQGNAGVTFNITDAGQIQYTSTSVSGTNYSGLIIFKAKVFNDVE